MEKTEGDRNIPGSFRDPKGFLFYRDGILYRQVNKTYKADYDQLMNSGLYKDLVGDGLLISHEEADIKDEYAKEAYRVIKPEAIPFISYPYEWSFSQLKNAALLTLKVQRIALQFNMSLKDSSAYNVQFKGCRPILIDTLSFERYREGRPWVAYRQFCQHFLAPLSLMSYKDVRLSQLLRIYIDGIPLDLASALLPFRSRFAFHLFSHIHLHARSQAYFAGKDINMHGINMSKLALLGIVDSLKSAVERLKWKIGRTGWSSYYNDADYSSDAFNCKREVVAEFLDKIKTNYAWDLGANVGVFSRIAGAKGIRTVSFDIDPACVEKNYLECVSKGETNILPLLSDLANPSPGIGWEGRERLSLMERAPADTVLALALVHHLAISNNLPLDRIAGFFDKICNRLIIEFVPKDDPQARRLLSTREDIFTGYTKEAFESAFGEYFDVEECKKIRDSKRILYLMRNKKSK